MATSKGGRKAQQKNMTSSGDKGNEEESMPMTQNISSDQEQTYRDFFEQHSNTEGVIPCSTLRRELRGASSSIPLLKMRELLRRADADDSGTLDWDEFRNLMAAGEVSLTGYENFLQKVVRVVAPQAEADIYLSQYNCKPPPLFMIIISAIELGIFIGYAVWLKPRGIETTMIAGAPLFSPLTFNPERRYEAWRFLGYMFIHNGVKHILSNLIFQLLLGLPLEMVHKFWRVGIVYCLGVIAGSLCTSVFDPRIFVVGASGGCYALIGAQFATVIMNWKEMTDGWLDSPLKFIMSAPIVLTFWGLYAAVDTGVAIWVRYSSPEGSQVAYAAHFAGLVAGILIGVPVLRNFKPLPWERVLWWVCLVSYMVLVIVGIILNICLPNYYPDTDWRPCCPCPKGYYPCPLAAATLPAVKGFNKTVG